MPGTDPSPPTHFPCYYGKITPRYQTSVCWSEQSAVGLEVMHGRLVGNRAPYLTAHYQPPVS